MLQTIQLVVLVTGVSLVLIFGTREMKAYFLIAFGSIAAVVGFALLMVFGGLIGAVIALGILLLIAAVVLGRRKPSQLPHQTND